MKKEIKFKFRDVLAAPFGLLGFLSLGIAVIIGTAWTSQQVLSKLDESEE
jgi:hypothetical protein